jgi:hypothetical protein
LFLNGGTDQRNESAMSPGVNRPAPGSGRSNALLMIA